MYVVFIRTLILYAIVVFGMRIMGKRQLGDLQPSELVVTILISNIATLPIENTNIPLLAGVVPILTLMCFEVVVSVCTLKNRRLRTIISGTPRVVISKGVIDQKELANLRYSVEDLLEQLRSSNIFDLREVELAIVETTGALSVYKKNIYHEVTMKDMNLPAQNTQPPVLVISDGELITSGIKRCSLTEQQVLKLLKKENRQLQDVFLMTCTPEKDYFIVPRDPSSKKGGK